MTILHFAVDEVLFSKLLWLLYPRGKRYQHVAMCVVAQSTITIISISRHAFFFALRSFCYYYSTVYYTQPKARLIIASSKHGARRSLWPALTS